MDSKELKAYGFWWCAVEKQVMWGNIIGELDLRLAKMYVLAVPFISTLRRVKQNQANSPQLQSMRISEAILLSIWL